jgi:hypothetical protein
MHPMRLRLRCVCPVAALRPSNTSTRCHTCCCCCPQARYCWVLHCHQCWQQRLLLDDLLLLLLWGLHLCPLREPVVRLLQVKPAGGLQQ